MTSETIQIRRYPNRRLYDRSRQRYITLPNIEELVLQGQTVEIQDSQTGEDMTRQILTQILLERHPDKIAMFPVGMLHSMLRANNLVSEFWRRYLRQSLDALENLQRSGVPFVSPLDWMSAILPGLTSAGYGPAEAPEAMARRIAALEERIKRIEAGEEHHPSPTQGGDAIAGLERRFLGLEDRTSK
jgi:polyhydroxyalkanoate synthesis repressor PhaR